MNKNVTVFFLTLLITSYLIAGTTGKIVGTVSDAKTGEALPGVNIVLVGTSYGAVSDFEGNYLILNLPPGTYTIRASSVGYLPVNYSSVRVNIDVTTRQDFKVSEETVIGDEVVIIATRPLVQKDQTAKTAVIGGDDIKALPVTEIGQVISLQAGMVDGKLRGGRSGEVAYWIDGVPVTDAYDGGQVVEVNKSIVQELQLISGAFNAEYGQAMSGIVNIATKEGSQKFTGGVGLYIGQYVVSNDKTYRKTADGRDSLTSELLPGLNKFSPTAIRNIEANLSGPILGEDLTFFTNVRYIYFDGYLKGFNRFNPSNIAYTDSLGKFQLYRDPSGKGDSSVVPMNNSERYYGQGKLTLRLTSLMKLTGNYIYDYTKSKSYDRNYFYNPNGLGNNYNYSQTFIFQLSHTLSQTTFYTLGGSLFKKDSKHYLYEDINDPRYVNPQVLQRQDSYSFYTGGTDLNYNNRSTLTGLIKFDISNQFDEMNLFKVGAEFRRHNLRYDNMNLQPIQEELAFDPAKHSPFIHTRIPDLSTTNHNNYLRMPYEMAGYIQDKMEFKNIIVNIGIRYDFFEPNGKVLVDPSDPSIYNPIKPGNRFVDTNLNGKQDPGEDTITVEQRAKYWYKKVSPKAKISPRLGVSFPITERGIVHFSYGHFYQMPRFERLYENPDFKIGLGTGNQGVVGNADLEPEQTINAELGIQQQLTDDISLDVTTYIRDIRGLTGTQGEEIIVFGGASKYSKYTNSDFGFVKGIVLTATKRFSDGLTATTDYTFQVARGTASDPNQARNAVAGGAQPDIQMTPLGWDQRHTLNTSIAFSGGNWGLSTIAQFGTGTPYTPRKSEDVSTLLTNSEIKPTFFNVDLQTYYLFDLDAVKFNLFARVFNLFDFRNETSVYDDTGRAGSTKDEATAQSQNTSQRVNTIDQWFSVPTNYSEPRRIEIGMNLEF
ncbi:MAG: TonB-dependent receptor [Bacteroidota bacterium]|nr:TonB-dependent receptor [Bacteroidota bacterium]